MRHVVQLEFDNFSTLRIGAGQYSISNIDLDGRSVERVESGFLEEIGKVFKERSGYGRY